MSYIFNSTKRNRKPNSWFRSHHKMRIQESGIRGIKRGLNGHWEDARLRTLRSQSGQMWRCSGESFLCWLCSNTTMLFCLRFVLAQCKGCLQKLTAAPGTGAKKKSTSVLHLQRTMLQLTASKPVREALQRVAHHSIHSRNLSYRLRSLCYTAMEN